MGYVKRRPTKQRQRGAPKKNKVTLLPAKSAQERYTVAQVIHAIEMSRGMVSAAAKMLGCIRGTIYDYRDRHPEVAEALAEANELQLDVAELNLFKAIDRSEPWSICFYLKTKGRQRGYIERHEIKATITVEHLVELIQRKEPKVING
jgi:hypothetical protein